MKFGLIEAPVATFFAVSSFDYNIVFLAIEDCLGDELADSGLVFDYGYAFHDWMV